MAGIVSVELARAQGGHLTDRSIWLRMLFTASVLTATFTPQVLHAQVTPAAPITPPDDTPSIRVGVVFYGDYTYTQNPQTTDADGNLINPSAFNVTRGYINITGNVSHLVSFRFTPDVTRETSAAPSISGSLVYRVKYAFAQVNLDDWMTRGSWVRFGANQTPLVDYEENIYRYRFQGTTFTEREGFLTSSDFGASFHYNFPSNYGDVHVGVYNGDGYSKAEANNQQATQIRATLRPFATAAPVLRGLRATVFYDGDHYIKNAERKRTVGQVTFEHTYLNAGFDYIDAKDQTSITKPDVEGKGWSFWLTPRSKIGLEALIRYDHMKPNTLLDAQVRKRTIIGVAYWFPHQGNAVNAAFLVDYDNQTFDNFAPALAKQTKIAVHALLTF
jgi:hypothetical protein